MIIDSKSGTVQPRKYGNNDSKSRTAGHQTIVLHLDRKVWGQVAQVAVEENVTISGIAAEALMVYVKWLRKAEKKEETLIQRQAREEKKTETAMLLAEIMEENRKSGRNRGRKKKR